MNDSSALPAGLVRQMSFTSVLLTKLNLIVWAAGGKKPAARKLGVSYYTFFRWFRVPYVSLCSASLKLVDDHYAVAFEKRCLHERKLEQRRLKRRGTEPDMNFSVDAV